MDETLFYGFGIALVVFALLVSFAGLRARSFPTAPLMAVLAVIFLALVSATATFAVRFSEEEQQHREAEEAHAAAEGEAGTAEEPAGGGATAEGPGAGPPTGGTAEGPGGTLQLAADPTEILFDRKTLTSKPGEVTIEFTNPSALQHDVAIEQGGDEIAKSELIAEGKTSVSAELAPGTYTFLCTVPGHAEAGMEGTLTVK